MSRSAATMLERALRDAATHAGCPVTATENHATRWASATFVGERHVITLEGPDGTAFDAWLEDLPEADWSLFGHLVADICVATRRRSGDVLSVDIEALTVQEA